jgi:hypothetical protein
MSEREELQAQIDALKDAVLMLAEKHNDLIEACERISTLGEGVDRKVGVIAGAVRELDARTQSLIRYR